MNPFKFDVVTLRGIGEQIASDRQTNMIRNYTDQLDKNIFRIGEFSPWNAQFGPVPNPAGAAYDRNRRVAVDALAQYITEYFAGPAPLRLILIGYSGGAHVLGDALRRIPWELRRRIWRVILVADPAMPTNVRQSHLVGTIRPNSWGLTGARTIWEPVSSNLLTWVSHDADAICSCPALSPLRTLADQLCSMSLTDLGGWGITLHAKLLARQFQPVSLTEASYKQAANDLDGYLRRGEHGIHYPPMLAKLGQTTNREGHK